MPELFLLLFLCDPPIARCELFKMCPKILKILIKKNKKNMFTDSIVKPSKYYCNKCSLNRTI